MTENLDIILARSKLFKIGTTIIKKQSEISIKERTSNF